MGIKRLSYYLRADFLPTDLSHFAKMTVAIDISSWIYQWYFCQYDCSGDPAILILRLMEGRLSLFKKHEITVISIASLCVWRPQASLQTGNLGQAVAEARVLPVKDRRRYYKKERKEMRKRQPSLKDTLQQQRTDSPSKSSTIWNTETSITSLLRLSLMLNWRTCITQVKLTMCCQKILTCLHTAFTRSLRDSRTMANVSVWTSATRSQTRRLSISWSNWVK